MKRQTGFTLVELVIVIAVLGILAGLAIPYFMEAREEAAKKECLANRTQILRMFHAQQASNYNGTLVGFLAEVVKEPNDNKYFNFVPKCADGGKYNVFISGREEDIECTKHGLMIVTSSMAEKLYKDFQDMLSRFFNPDGTLNTVELKKELGNDYESIIRANDKLREYFLKNFGGKWEQVKGSSGSSYDLTFHTTSETGKILIYANSVKDDLNKQPWKAKYIYDSSNKKWYYNKDGVDLASIGAKDKTESQIINAWKSKANEGDGWEEVTLTGNTFSK